MFMKRHIQSIASQPEINPYRKVKNKMQEQYAITHIRTSMRLRTDLYRHILLKCTHRNTHTQDTHPPTHTYIYI